MGLGRELTAALRGQLESAGTRSSAGSTSGITRTRIYSGPCYLNAITVIPDDANAPTTTAFWSIDDSAVSASGSGGAAIVGSYIHQTTAASDFKPYVESFLRGLPLDNGLTFNYTATGTGLGLRYSVWYTPKKDPSLP